MTCSSNFLHAVTFLHVLHLDILRSQIELKLKVKTANILMYGYNAGLRRSRRVNESIVLCYSVLEKYQFSCKISGLLFTWFTCCDVRYGLHYNVLLELIIICYTRSKRVNGKIICLCTCSDENLFTCKISGQKLLRISSYASS